MKLLKILSLGFIAYVVGAFLMKMNRGRTVTQAATESIVEPVGFAGSVITLAASPSKWQQSIELTTTAAKEVITDPSYAKSRDVVADWATGIFGLASEVPSAESVADTNARTLSETQVPGTLEANPSSTRGMVYSGPLY